MNDRDGSDLEELLSELTTAPKPNEEDEAMDDTELPLAGNPTLSTLDEKRRPNPMPVCGLCPHAMWFASGQELKCYCRILHAITWNNDEPAPIVVCDGILLPE